MKIYLATYSTPLDVECMLDDKYNPDAMMINILATFAYAPVIERHPIHALNAAIRLMNDECLDDRDDEPPADAINDDNVHREFDHELASPHIAIYRVDHPYCENALIAVREINV